MLNFLRKQIPERSPIRKQYHKMRAMWSAFRNGFPANNLHVIGITGTSGKSTTVALTQHILHAAGIPTGAISTTGIMIGTTAIETPTLRTTQRPSFTQNLLKQMVANGMEKVVIEVSSHAIDQERLWGVNIDTAVLTNIYDNEHLDYHGTFQDYVSTKAKLFRNLNAADRKPGIAKVSVLNRDDAMFDLFNEPPADKKWTYARRTSADIKAENVVYHDQRLEFDLRLPNAQVHIDAPLIGAQNLENLLCAITIAVSHGVPAESLPAAIASFPGVAGRLETVSTDGHPFQVIVDFTYKPSALQSTLGMLSKLTKGKLKVIWGGAGGRSKENYEASAKLIDQYADEFILTTDDPGDVNPKYITQIVAGAVNRTEGDGTFWQIEDRYEAIRYGLLTAEPGDVVIIAGRGHEKVQVIGKQRISFDDREVAKEILKTL